ncbi:DUF554 domain-containing protein [Feifania hominis]|uniref:DUF554 domain-containing protein n=1 Tax=Feifania hominis TaxID=2763660 RepID=A0A926HQP5_9FIRM|nr:DUF554 domain-containing protein [Feifania hominis]MBC8536567.1 DUF554 domain-containing protein [Feifania hominis]
MPGLGTIVNTLAILAGALVGLLIRRGLPEHISDSLTNALGISTLMIGISGTLTGLFRVKPDGLLDRVDLLLLIVSLVVGTLIGELLNIDRGFERVGQFAERRLGRNDGRTGRAFVESSLLFCVGAMAIVGAIEDGLAANPTTLYAKSLLDGVASIIYASTLGAGVLLSAGAVLLYQGTITVASFFISQYISDALMLQISMIGSAIIICIGLNLLGLKRIKVANMIPAVLVPVAWALIGGLFG